jgi:hypothetical protein
MATESVSLHEVDGPPEVGMFAGEGLLERTFVCVF